MMLWTARTWRFCRTHGRTLLVLLLPVLVVPVTAAAQSPKDYLVGPNDVLVITVFDQPQLSGKYLVQADGSVTFPLLGRLRAGGMSMQAVEDDLRGRLISGGFLTKPEVAVTIDQYRSQQVFVMGEVRQPGSLQFTGSMDVIEALARAGAVTDRADTEAVIVRARNSAPGTPAAPAAVPRDAAAIARAQTEGSADIIKIDLQELQSGALKENVSLRPGDTIFVPRAKSVFVSGQVRTAGEYVIRRGMTVRQVIALAGGVTDRGSTKRIQVVRRTEDKEVTQPIQLQDLVQPGDTIVVRDRFF